MSEVITDKLTGKATAGDVTITSEGGAVTMQLQQGMCKSWINQQNDSSQNNTNDSFNVASDVDNGNGDSTFTVTSAFSSDAFVCNTGYGNNTVTDRCGVTKTSGNGTQQSSTTYRSFAYDMSANAAGNCDGLQVICMGDLA